MKSISKRAAQLIANPSPIVTGHIKCLENPYSHNNPEGFLNFGIAQNHLMEEETVSFVTSHTHFSKEDIHYNAGHGKLSLRMAFAHFAAQFLNTPPMNPELVSIQTGVSALCESLAYCLFDEGDTLLMPAPYYSGFIYDFSRRFNVKIETVELKEENHFKHHFADFKQRLLECRPKAVLLTHPYNPTGEILDIDFYTRLVDFCQQEKIHIITDEIYALSYLNGGNHHSLLHFDYENIHFMYGMAKDFTLAGLKMGFFYTRNETLAQAMQAVSYFHTTSTQTQNTLEALLKDDHFIKTYITTNQQRIKSTYQKIKSNLPHLQHTRPDAGIFFLADFRYLLKEKTAKGEIDLFHYFIDELKINMTPGQAMGMQEYGFFRVCYAKNDAEIEEFIKRFNHIRY